MLNEVLSEKSISDPPEKLRQRARIIAENNSNRHFMLITLFANDLTKTAIDPQSIVEEIATTLKLTEDKIVQIDLLKDEDFEKARTLLDRDELSDSDELIVIQFPNFDDIDPNSAKFTSMLDFCVDSLHYAFEKQRVKDAAHPRKVIQIYDESWHRALMRQTAGDALFKLDYIPRLDISMVE